VGTAGEDIEKIVARLEKSLEIYNAERKHAYSLSLSIGVTYYDPENPCSMEELLIQADELTQKVQLTAGMYAAKALVQHLCERFHDPENGHIFIPGFSIDSRRKFCVQEVLMHMCLLSFHRNALFGLMYKHTQKRT